MKKAKNIYIIIIIHFSIITGFCLMDCNGKTLQHLPYIWSMRILILGIFFHFMLFYPKIWQILKKIAKEFHQT